MNEINIILDMMELSFQWEWKIVNTFFKKTKKFTTFDKFDKIKSINQWGREWSDILFRVRESLPEEVTLWAEISRKGRSYPLSEQTGKKGREGRRKGAGRKESKERRKGREE